MLFKDPSIVSPGMFSLIRQLCSESALDDFALGGGAALSLQLGHRKIFDLDFFSHADFSSGDLSIFLYEKFRADIICIDRNIVQSYINESKADFARPRGRQVAPFVVENGIRMLSLEDIAAMKLYVIARSGKRFVDFADVYFLMKRFSVTEMIRFFEKRYPLLDPLAALKRLRDFSAVDRIQAVSLELPLTADEIMKGIMEGIDQPDQKRKSEKKEFTAWHE